MKKLFLTNKVGFGICLLVLISAISSCVKSDDYKKYLEGGEIVYPTMPDSIRYYTGKDRFKIQWKKPVNPNIDHYLVYWNQRKDSLQVSLVENSAQDSVSILIDSKVQEGANSLYIYVFDKAGNRSLVKEFTAISFGNNYIGRLRNRALLVGKSYEFKGNDLYLNFQQPDTIHVTTRIRFQHLDGSMKELFLSTENATAMLSGYKAGSEISVRSSYIPQQRSIDVFWPQKEDQYIFNP